MAINVQHHFPPKKSWESETKCANYSKLQNLGYDKRRWMLQILSQVLSHSQANPKNLQSSIMVFKNIISETVKENYIRSESKTKGFYTHFYCWFYKPTKIHTSRLLYVVPLHSNQLERLFELRHHYEIFAIMTTTVLTKADTYTCSPQPLLPSPLLTP